MSIVSQKVYYGIDSDKHAIRDLPKRVRFYHALIDAETRATKAEERLNALEAEIAKLKQQLEQRQ